MKHQQQGGFTLVEVLIASAIIMASLGVLLQLFGSGLSQTKKAGRTAHYISAQRTIERQLMDINPALQKDGKGNVEGIVYRWHAVRIEPFRVFYDRDIMPNRLFALFRITVELDAWGKSKQMVISRLGWKNKS